MLLRAAFATIVGLTLLTGNASGDVVINELQYHPPDDQDDLQWIELLNAGTAPVNLARWSLTGGIRFTVTNALQLPPKGLLVIARDLGAFRTHYGTNLPAVGDFSGRLSHGGERITLLDAAGKLVDSVLFGDSTPWPSSPDGLSPSLERLLPAGPGDDPHNWAPSPMPRFRSAAGTPGFPNASATSNLPPVIQSVQFQQGAVPAGTPLGVSAEVADADGVSRVVLHHTSLPVASAPSNPALSPASTESASPMIRVQGDARRGVYRATIPPSPPGSVVRFRIEAVDQQGSLRWLPHPDDSHPTWSVYSGSLTNPAAIPFAFLAQHGPEERPGQSLRTMNWGRPRSRNPRLSAEPSRGNATLAYLEPGSSQVLLFDHIRITPRQGGWKVRLHKDHLLGGMSTVNLIFEHRPRFVLAEHLAYEVYRAADLATPLSGHWRTWYNGRPMGYHLSVEQPNGTFLRRAGRDPEGDLFKLIWYGGDLIGQHEKKNNPETGHAQLVETVETLNQTRGADQWREIERRFQVESFVNYYAVNMLIQNWDGFFNNYFLYRSPGANGKWEIIPWDEDKTWGDYDGASAQYDWYSMPLTFGMAGDQPKLSLRERFFGGGGPFGGQMWWRQPGWFSGPLLANPEFRARFKSRLRQLLTTTFTPTTMEEPIARLEKALEPEVRFRAQIIGSRRNQQGAIDFGVPEAASEVPQADTAAALDQFHRHIDSFRRQVRFRREFLLKELDRDP